MQDPVKSKYIWLDPMQLSSAAAPVHVMLSPEMDEQCMNCNVILGYKLSIGTNYTSDKWKSNHKPIDAPALCSGCSQGYARVISDAKREARHAFLCSLGAAFCAIAQSSVGWNWCIAAISLFISVAYCVCGYSMRRSVILLEAMCKERNPVKFEDIYNELLT